MRRKMIRRLSLALIVMGLASYLLISKFGTYQYGGSYFLGAILGIVNGVVGFLIIEMFIDRSNMVFLKGVSIGMGTRLLLLLGVFILMVKVFGAQIAALVTGLLIFYFAMTIFEIIFLNKRIQLKKGIGETAS